MASSGVSAPARLGRYELLARLATGGMGEIFLARLEGAAGFEKLCVVKRILPHLADDARFRQMLIAEAQIAAKMAHASICQVNELGETAGQLYIAMEYLEGVALQSLLRRASKTNGQLELGFVGGVVQQVTEALHYAHELKDRGGEPLGLVHRDVTPANIFVCETGVTKVLDFGIAKARGASAKTEDGAVKGKYAYMAPEQLRGGGIDRRVDLFALGVVMFEMLALRRLFQRKTDYLTFRAVMEQPIPDVRRYRMDIPEPVAQVLARALDRDPATRFETARQLGTAMLDAIGKRPWSQGELGDYVKHHFAAELAQRARQVATAIGIGTSGQRSTMPLLAHVDVPDPDDGDEDDFPPVETEVDGAPPPAADAFVQGTPPPFAAVGDSTSAPELKPLNLGPAPTTGSAAPAKRSVLWPILAGLGVLVAAGALLLVWQQMKQQRTPQPPAVINVTQAPAPVASAPPSPAVAPAEAAAAIDPTPPAANRPAHAHATKSAHYATYDSALAAQKGSLTQCLIDHRDAIPNEEIAATIQIAADGRAQVVQLKPDAINAAPLGGCFRNVLMATPFPPAAAAKTINVPLKPKAS